MSVRVPPMLRWPCRSPSDACERHGWIRNSRCVLLRLKLSRCPWCYHLVNYLPREGVEYLNCTISTCYIYNHLRKIPPPTCCKKFVFWIKLETQNFPCAIGETEFLLKFQWVFGWLLKPIDICHVWGNFQNTYLSCLSIILIITSNYWKVFA